MNKKPKILIGIHDPLSALLAQRAGFKMLWASGFGFSTVSGIPDVNLITLSENLELLRRIVNVVNIPVIADCDSGYGDIIMVSRLVQDYEKVGIAGICIEDNIYPKRNSFYKGVKRELATIEEHIAKIKIAKEFRKSKKFLIFARTEALIAGLGQKEALLRAEQYVRAGADVIVIHSKKDDASEVLEFARNWKLKTPLAIIPTTYFKTPIQRFASAGFRYLIYANQLIRSTIGSMEKTLVDLKKEESRRQVDKTITTMSHIFNIVGVDKIKELEKKFLE